MNIELPSHLSPGLLRHAAEMGAITALVRIAFLIHQLLPLEL